MLQAALNKTCGISVMFIAIAGAMQGMMHIDAGNIVSSKSMLVVLCLAIGTIVGELLGIEEGFERFGEWLKKKTGNSGDKQFVNAFVTASLTVCIGAMAIVGAIQDGIMGDYSTLAAKAVLDFNRKRISLQRHCRAFMKDMTGSFTAWFRETENRK